MPYICLIRSDIPDGSVYIKSLRSESQRVPAYDPPGQARYINRVQNDHLYLSTDGAISQETYGLTAYLADCLEPGGTEVPTGTVTSAGPLVGDTLTVGGVVFTAAESTATGTITPVNPIHGDTVTVKGIVFTATANFAVGTATMATVALGDIFTLGGVAFTAAGAAANPALQQFDETAGSDILVAGSLATAINDAASQAAITLANPGVTVAAANGGTATVTITAGQRGLLGQLTLATTLIAPGTILLSGAAMVAAVPDAGLREFAALAQAVGGTNIAVATSLALAINDLTAGDGGQTLILAAAPVGVGCAATNVAGTSATVTLTATAPGAQGEFALLSAVTFTLSGAAMVSVAPNPALQQFASLIEAGSNALVATSIQATINNAASQLLLVAANGGYTVACGAPAVATVTLTPNVAGELGAFTLATSAPARITLSDDHFTRTFEVWTAAQLNAISLPIIALMDAGLPLTTVAINAAINAVAGVSNTSIVSVGSTTTLANLLSVMAGRGYYVPAGAPKIKATGTWDITAYGGFGKPYLAQDSRMLGGEIRPNTIGGDASRKEVKPIRHTYVTDELITSLDDGEVAVFIAKVGMPPVTLWPRSGLIPQYPWTYQKALLNPKTHVNDAQIIVVYADDGTILV